MHPDTRETPSDHSEATLWPSLLALVLGGSGLIGRHVVGSLLRRGVRVRVLLRPASAARNLQGLEVERVPGDLGDAASIDRALEGCDLVFHCAAPYPRSHFDGEIQCQEAAGRMAGFLEAARRHVPPEILRLPPGHLRQKEFEQAEAAALAILHQPEREEEFRREMRAPGLLDAAISGRLDVSLHPPLREVAGRPGLKRIIYVSSVTTIGRPRGRPRPGGAPPDWADEADRQDLVRLSSPYFAMKEEMEAMATRAAVEGLPIVIGNPTFCVDAFDAAPTSGLLLMAVARKMLTFYLPGTVNVVAARDVGEALVLSAARGRTGQRYILGGENMSNRAFLTLVAEVAGVPPPRVPLPLALAEGIAWATEILNRIARRPWPLLPLSGVQMMRASQPLDCRLAHAELGQPSTPIRTAVADGLNWLKENGYL